MKEAYILQCEEGVSVLTLPQIVKQLLPYMKVMGAVRKAKMTMKKTLFATQKTLHKKHGA